MGGPTWSTIIFLAHSEVRAELGRLGLAKEDFERLGFTMADLDREVLRLYAERGQGPVSGIVGEVLGRVRPV